MTPLRNFNIKIIQGNFEPFKSFLSFVFVNVKERILQKGEELFFKHGVRSVTMDDIAQSLGVSKKTIYQNFKDKRMFVNAVTQTAMNREVCKERDFLKAASNPIEAIIFARQMMREHLANSGATLIHDLKKYYPSAYKCYEEHKESFREVMVNNLKEGIEGGYYRADINVEMLAILRSESVDLAFNNDTFPSTQFNLLDVQLAFIDHFVRGIVTEKGLKVYEALK
ncbi:TetR/AcrR family transcriptional regulator [Arcticibacterium luteifluviistationis]|uniref:TetR/AcrR family transcriptional regulator n=1 Tax=Arcticibacterium luteifluviistationis TaxID=1784714 RepID=UPI0013A6CD2A|nr:TetR/AcrR family transcriptional regulator [Arcticibacterium luteifluviistationis]